jgi:amino acid adenylation domain-containing protein
VSVPPLEKVSRQGDLPLSFAQQRLWFIDRLEPGLSLYNMPFPVRLEGPLKASVMEYSLLEILRRHEVLRTTFSMKDGKPWQKIAPEASFQMPRIDLQGLPEAQREPMARRLLVEDSGRSFDLARGPVLRASLVLLAPEEAILLFNLHHIAGDGWSMDVLVQEVSELYVATSKGEPAQLPELPVQYADFSVWQRGWLQGEVLEAEIAYWRERLGGKPSLLELPTDRPRPIVSSFRGDARGDSVSVEAGEALRSLARQQGATLFMVALAGFCWTLSRLSGQNDISVGTPSAGRDRLELEPLIGFFINTLVLRVDLSGAPTFLQVLQQVREVSLEAQSHQDVPFERLVEELEPERNLGKSPLFQVMFITQDLAQEPPELGEVKVIPVEGEGSTAKFDLSMSVSESADGGLDLGLEFATDLFDGTTLERWLGNFSTLLTGVAAAPERPLTETSLLRAAERHQLQVEWNDTERLLPGGDTLSGLFSQHVASRGQAVALVRGDVQLSYGELARRALSVAGSLLEWGVEPGGLVGLYTERSVEMVISKLGILLAGQGYVPLDPTFPAERLRWLIEDADLKVVMTHHGVTPALPAAALREGEVELLEFESLVGAAPQPWPENASGRDIAYVMYTSGSTGRPKGVMVPQRAVVRLVRGTPSFADFSPREVFLHLSPVSFDAAPFEIWGPLLNGGRLVLLPAGLPALDVLGSYLARYRISFQVLTTGLFHLMVDERLEDLAVLGQLVVGGDIISPERAQKVLELPSAPRLINAYGPTENATMTTFHRVENSGEVRVPTPIGRPVGNTEVWIADRQLRPVPLGAFGELLTSGVGLARGYQGRPALTSERFVPHPCAQRAGDRVYRTGDLARLLADGSVEFAGRFDHQVKLRGFRIEPGEIEAALVRQKSVAAAFVMVHEDAGLERLVAYVVGTDGAAPLPEVLQAALAEELPAHLVPSIFMALDALPLTANGKLDREALPDPEAQLAVDSFVAPRDQMERNLALIWKDLLDVKEVGIHDDFFALGGHSLLGIQLMSRLQRVLGHELPVAALFKAPTVAGLASILRGEGAGGLYDSLMPFHTEGSKAPVFYIHPGGGMVFLYRPLVEGIGQDRPAYGLQSQGLEGRVAPFDSIQGMASHYIEEIRGVQAEGPYHLIGWSMGGVIAFEMARQFSELGEKVALLGLLDSHIPTVFDRIGERDEMALLERFAQNFGLPMDISIPMEEFMSLGQRERIEYLLERAREIGDMPEDFKISRVMRYFQIFKLNSQALAAYRPGPYHGRVLLLKASEPFPTVIRNPDISPFDRFAHRMSFLGRWLKLKLWDRLVNSSLGWSKIEGCEVERGQVPGDHFSILLEPKVKNLAERLRQALEELETED